MTNRFIAFALLVIISGIFSGQAHAQSRAVFSGVPALKISKVGVERIPEKIPRDKAIDLGCAISEIGGRYYRANRENTEMARIVSGAFVTYVAINGSGYVRVINKSFKAAASLMSPTEAEFDYVKHILWGLRTVTYYGNSQ